MKKIKLDTATFEFVEPRIMQVTVSEGVEIDLGTATEYRNAIAELTHEPTGLLVNKKNRYSLTFDAQHAILSHLPNIIATALWVHSSISGRIADTQIPMLKTAKHPVRVFFSQTEAIAWLKDQLPHASH
ncbi:MAG: hypothetical protein GC138_07880 [Gammaproteobacteria bacterium]|nr:hypothetical protein [Gammaproteobacteria bacterium]